MTDLIQRIRDSIIGRNTRIETPYGTRPLIYADHTASGRALEFIEDAIRQNVLPFYANTHSESAFTGAQTNHFREQAREQIRSSVNGTSDDLVIFCGSGATAAVNKLVNALGLGVEVNGRTDNEAPQPEEADRPVVFVGPYEHHSNELPWRECQATVVRIPLDVHGAICQRTLALQLGRYQTRPLKIGSFSAASNVTGRISDADAITRLLHSHGALAFWDYAAAAPYLPIDMNGNHPIDAVFVSPHKFIGGPGTPGVLIAKRHLFRNSVPTTVGGGTVTFVGPDRHCYTSDIQAREEGGTPAIVESIRAGMVFKLQADVGLERIAALEQQHAREVLPALAQEQNIDILGCPNAKRLPIVSFRIKHGERHLHYGYVVALLNDLFGIQARGGCSCAGPYAHNLLQLSDAESRHAEELVDQGAQIYRPGWVRLNFNYFISNEERQYIVSAIRLIARQGWRLLRDYQPNPRSGLWQHRHRSVQLADLSYELAQQAERDEQVDFDHLLNTAAEILHAATDMRQGETASHAWCEADEETKVRWFAIAEDHSDVA